MRIKDSYSGSNVQDNKKSTKTRFSEEVGVFEEKVKDRLKNGEPAVNMGRTAFTEQDWEELMDHVDSYIESVRRLNATKKEKIDESLEKKTYDKIKTLINS